MSKSSYPTSAVKVDNADKCSGKALYVDDLPDKGFLIARTLRSPVQHGILRAVHLPPLPDGYYFVNRNDVPGENVVNMIFSDWPVFSDGTLNYYGEPIGLIVGPDKAVVEDILRNVELDCVELPAVDDFTDSVIHKAYKKGDYEKAKAKAKHVFKESFSTGYQEQAYLEPQGGICYLEDGDKFVIKASMQCPYYIKNAVKRALGVPGDKVRIIQPAVGGAFGGKEDYPSVIGCQLAVAVHKIGKPVKMIYEREEDINFTTKRHPSRSEYEALVDENDNVIGVKAHVSLDGGAFKGLSGVVLARSLIAAVNVYDIPNLDISGDVYHTNSVPTGAFRGFGSPQAIFAIEMFMHHMAFDLGIEPLAFKRKHLVKQGDLTATNGLFHDPIIMDKLIDRAIKISDYENKLKKYRDPKCHRGIGMSFFFHGCGFTGSGESDEIHAKVRLRKTREDKVYVDVAAVDYGQGNRTTLKRIVALNLDLPDEQVILNPPDTDIVPDSGPTVASRTIMIVGYLLEKAAKRLKSEWMAGKEQESIENYKGPDYIKFDEETLQGDAYPSYSWGVNVCEAEVSPITYEVSLKGIWAVYDVGHRIDERIIAGQADGGVIQAMGYGYLENMERAKGHIRQKNLTDYIIPTSADVPPMKSEFIDNPFVYGPHGAKGAGELTFVGGAPAVALAVEEAIKTKVNKIPVTPEYIMELVNGKD